MSSRHPGQRPSDAGSLSHRAYRVLRDLIVSLELAPGAVIDERALIERLGIGRTPIREALQRLELENLVEVYPRRGVFVTGVDIGDLARLSEVRLVLESEAARLAARRATDADRDELAALIEELGSTRRRSERELIALDERVHRTVARCARNRFLASTLEEYFTLALRIWYLALDRAHELEDAVLGHATMLEAIGDGDGRRAAALMHHHIQEFERAMHRVLGTVSGAPAPSKRSSA